MTGRELSDASIVIKYTLLKEVNNPVSFDQGEMERRNELALMGRRTHNNFVVAFGQVPGCVILRYDSHAMFLRRVNTRIISRNE
jgi:hypothetical protein